MKEVIVLCGGRNGRKCGHPMNLSIKGSEYYCPECGNVSPVDLRAEITALNSLRTPPEIPLPSPRDILGQRRADCALHQTGERPKGCAFHRGPMTVTNGNY